MQNQDYKTGKNLFYFWKQKVENGCNDFDKIGNLLFLRPKIQYLLWLHSKLKLKFSWNSVIYSIQVGEWNLVRSEFGEKCIKLFAFGSFMK